MGGLGGAGGSRSVGRSRGLSHSLRDGVSHLRSETRAGSGNGVLSDGLVVAHPSRLVAEPRDSR